MQCDCTAGSSRVPTCLVIRCHYSAEHCAGLQGAKEKWACSTQTKTRTQFVRKHQVKRPLGKTWRRWKNDIKKDHRRNAPLTSELISTDSRVTDEVQSGVYWCLQNVKDDVTSLLHLTGRELPIQISVKMYEIICESKLYDSRLQPTDCNLTDGSTVAKHPTFNKHVLLLSCTGTVLPPAVGTKAMRCPSEQVAKCRAPAPVQGCPINTHYEDIRRRFLTTFSPHCVAEFYI